MENAHNLTSSRDQCKTNVDPDGLLRSPTDILSEDLLNNSNMEKAHNLTSSGDQCKTNDDPDARVPISTDILSEDLLTNTNMEKVHNLTSSGDQCKTNVEPDARLPSPTDILSEDLLNNSNIEKAHNPTSYGDQSKTNADPDARFSSPTAILSEDLLNNFNMDKAHNLASSGDQCKTNVDPDSRELSLATADNIPQCFDDSTAIHDINEFCEEEQTSEQSQCNNSRVNVSQDSDILNAGSPKRKRRICIEDFYVLEAGCSDKIDNHKQTESENDSISEFVCSTPELYSHRRYNYHCFDGKSPKVKVGNLPLDNIFAKYLNKDTPRRKRRRLK